MKNYQKEVFYFSVLVDFLFSIYLLRYKSVIAIWGIFLGSVAITCIVLIEKKIFKNWKLEEGIRTFLFVSLGFHLTSFYHTSSRICYKSEKYDHAFLAMDDFLLGWIFPKGQIALWIENQKYINPTTYIGIFINTVMIIFYSLYFLVHILVLSVHLLIYWKELKYRLRNGGKVSKIYEKILNNFYFSYATFILSYIPVLFINLLYPGWSPRIYIKDEYKTELKFVPFLKFLNICKKESANTFPSGHIAESLAHFFTLHKIKYNKTKWIVFVIAFFIFWSTLLLRKHYFIDLVAGILISIISYLIPFIFGYLKNDQQVMIKGRPNVNETTLIKINEIDPNKVTITTMVNA